MKALSFEQAQAQLFRRCNSYQRMPELLLMRRHMGAPDWWRLLGSNWTTCDNITSHKERLRGYLLKANGRNLAAMMRALERRALSYLPPVVTVYRDCYAVNRDGLSWTLCREVACRFPTLHRYKREVDVPLLLTGAAERASVVLKLDRGEREVICAAVRVTNEQVAA